VERIVALMDDLFFQMKVAETAKHLGLELKVATNGDALLELLEPTPKLVIVDLNARSQPLAAIARVHAAQKDLRVIGFLSHVQRDLAMQAQAAGCDEVMHCEGDGWDCPLSGVDECGPRTRIEFNSRCACLFGERTISRTTRCPDSGLFPKPERL
jgi:CheY-like chemotaxis protein